MKKISVLFGVLAIVIAIGSAFTTKPTFTKKWEVFGVTADQVSTSSSASFALTKKISDAFNRVSTSSITSFAAERTAYNGSNITQVSCAEDNDTLCGIVVSYEDTPDNGLEIVNPESFTLGDYSLQ